MNLNFDTSADLEKKSQVFSSIQRIDGFFSKNFAKFDSFLESRGIHSLGDYESFISQDPANEVNERQRLHGAIKTMEKIKSFNEDYSMPSHKLVASSYMEVQEALNKEMFKQETGLTLELDHKHDGTGVLLVNVDAVVGDPKKMKLPYVTQWKEQLAEDYEGNDVTVKVGKLVLLSSGSMFPSLTEALSKFSFTEAPNIGLMTETGFSQSDLSDPDILMKTDIVDYSDTMELLSYASRRMPASPVIENRLAI